MSLAEAPPSPAVHRAEFTLEDLPGKRSDAGCVPRRKASTQDSCLAGNAAQFCVTGAETRWQSSQNRIR